LEGKTKPDPTKWKGFIIQSLDLTSKFSG
jgi:hypothetical protein